MEHGANFNAEDEDGDRALHLAVSRQAVIEILPENSPKISVVSYVYFVVSRYWQTNKVTNIGLTSGKLPAQKRK